MQVRVHLLPALLEEAYAELHARLCASPALGRKLFQLPFHRDVAPTARLVDTMVAALEHCKQARAWAGGCGGWGEFHRSTAPPCPAPKLPASPLQECGVLLTTPERRLSLVLKQNELWQRGDRKLSAALDRVLGQPYVDLLDESDELLSHRWVTAGGRAVGARERT